MSSLAQTSDNSCQARLLAAQIELWSVNQGEKETDHVGPESKTQAANVLATVKKP